MPIDLPLSRYHFEFEVQADLQLPVQAGALWHSVFGRNLKDLVCIAKKECCEQCMFQQQCDYTQLFRGMRPQNSTIMRKYNTIPVPHVFQTTLDTKTHFRAGETVSVDVVLCGNANEKLPSLCRALYVSGLKGLGKHRSKLTLRQLQQETADGSVKSLLAENQLHTALDSCAVDTKTAPERVLLEFLTPYKPSGKANNGHGIDFGRFLMVIIRRVDLMQYFTTGNKLSADFKALKALTESIRINDVELDFHHSSRYSAAKGGLKDTSGFVGRVEFDLRNHELLWPFLVVGEWLNVGKNSSMGFGRYKLSPVT